MTEPTPPPFVQAQRVWDDRYEQLARQRNIAMTAMLVSLILNALLSGGLFYLATHTPMKIHVVEVDQHGHAVAFGPAEELVKPEARSFRYHLREVVTALRTIYGNHEAQRHALSLAQAYFPRNSPATNWLREHFRVNNPYAPNPDRATVSVHVTSVLELGPETWQIQWTETPRNLAGAAGKPQAWQAVLKTRVVPPADSAALLLNPLGIQIVQIDWTRLS